jgi:hypothetical protein
MNRAAKWTLAAIVVLAAIWLTGRVVSRYRDERLRREIESKAEALKVEIEQRFPIGTPRSMVVAFLRVRPGTISVNGVDNTHQAESDWLSIGQESSRVWYCGPWEVGVLVKFREDRLVNVEATTWGFNCP